MPIGVPRIIYCWGEEVPAQWTDIYNFIFRRRMVFLMQYLDDELCNQICGLLINIHMEDRGKELEKREMENSGLFKSSLSRKNVPSQDGISSSQSFQGRANNSPQKLIEDLLISEQDLGIEENNSLERYTLQKMTLEWLNWNSQFFDYSEEPYLFYLAEILSKDFEAPNKEGQLYYNETSSFDIGASQIPQYELAKLIMMFKNISGQNIGSSNFSHQKDKFDPKIFDGGFESENKHFDVYSPFRLLSNLVSPHYSDFNIEGETKIHLANKFKDFQSQKARATKLGQISFNGNNTEINKAPVQMTNLISDLAQKNLFEELDQPTSKINFSEKAFTQKQLRSEYKNHPRLSSKPASYLTGKSSSIDNRTDYRDYSRKPYGGIGSSGLSEEESKKVFMIINSFGGSVGNGITVHDALQFIKAGSLTLGLGVAASAASLALAGGTIGERYVTEGCHTMLHQPESSISGQASDIWIDSKEIMKIRLDVAEIYSLATYRPRHKILRDLDRDFYLTAGETISYGLADEIATNEVMHEIISMTSQVWDYHDSQQQRLLESRESVNAGTDTQSQN